MDTGGKTQPRTIILILNQASIKGSYILLNLMTVLSNILMSQQIKYKSYKHKVTANCVYRKRTPNDEEGVPKTIKINFRTDEYMTKNHPLNLNQGFDHAKDTYEGYGYDYEFIGVSEVQLNIEKTKPSLGSYTVLPHGLRSKTKAILNIRINKFNCLRFCITAAILPAADHATKKVFIIITQMMTGKIMRALMIV